MYSKNGKKLVTKFFNVTINSMDTYLRKDCYHLVGFSNVKKSNKKKENNKKAKIENVNQVTTTTTPTITSEEIQMLKDMLSKVNGMNFLSNEWIIDTRAL